MRRSHILKFVFSLAVALLIPLFLFSESATKHGVDIQGMDKSVSACKDFFHYANGNWLAHNEIPADRASWGSFSMLLERNLEVLHQILEESATDTNALEGSALRKVGDFYFSGMNADELEKGGAKPLEEEFARINGIQDAAGLQDEISRLHRNGIHPAFQFFVLQDFKNSTQMIAQLYQGGLGMPDRDYYLSEDEKMKETRQEYVKHLEKMFTLLGDTSEQAAAEAKTVMEMETRLARASMTQVEQRDPDAIYHKTNLTELGSMIPSISWNRYFPGIGLADPGDVNLSQPEFFKELGKMLTEIPLENWKAYLRWHVINAMADRLSSPFVDEDFHFNGTVIRGTKELQPRWKRVVTATDENLGETLGQVFVEKAFSPEAKAKAREMIDNFKSVLHDRILTLDWMGEETKKQALRKLDAIRVKVGYPDQWRDYSALSIDRGPYALNVMRAQEFELQRNLNKIGKPVDRGEWQMTPPTVNAYYDASYNDINFPAGILQPPFFDPKADDASNYGAIGMTIGHEITHGFDDEGRKFDADGNLKSWWTQEDEKNFNERSIFVDKQYSNYVAIDTMHVNGKLTLGENIADIGGLKLAYLALQKSLEGKRRPPKIDGLTPEQRFFIAFAEIWRGKERPEQLRLRLTTNPHSPYEFRVIGPLSHMPEFYRAFGCKQEEAGVNKSMNIW